MNTQKKGVQFNATDDIDVFAEMIHSKVKYHEDKINSSLSEEDIKFRETKIKRLQKALFDARNFIVKQDDEAVLQSDIHLFAL